VDVFLDDFLILNFLAAFSFLSFANHLSLAAFLFNLSFFNSLVFKIFNLPNSDDNFFCFLTIFSKTF